MPPKGFVLDEQNLPTGFVFDKPKPPKGFVLDQPPTGILPEPPPELPSIAEPTPTIAPEPPRMPPAATVSTERPVVAPELHRPEYITTPRDIRPPSKPSVFWQKTKQAWDIGGKQADLDFQWRDVKYGRMTQEQAEESETEFDKRSQEDPLKARNWLEKQYLKTISIAHPMVSGEAKGITWGVIGGLGAIAAGQAGPQIALPEELVTAPAAFGVGHTAGALSYWAEQGEGSVYKEAIKSGLSHKTASTVSSIGGPIYGAIEFSQVDKFIPKLGGFAKRTVLSAIVGYLKRIGVEVLEEGEQKVVTEGVVKLLGKALEQKIALADVPEEARKIGLSALGEMKEAIGPMTILALPSGAIDIGRAAIAEPPAKKPPEPIKPLRLVPTPEVVEKPPEPPPVAVTPERRAVLDRYGFKTDESGAIIAYHGTDRAIEGKFVADPQMGAFFSSTAEDATEYGKEAIKRQGGQESDLHVYEVRIRPESLGEVQYDSEGNAVLPEGDYDAYITSQAEGDLEVIDSDIIEIVRAERPLAAPTPAKPTVKPTEVEVIKEPGPPKTLEVIRKEGQKEVDTLIIKPTSKPTKKIIPAKGKKILRVSLEDKDETITFLDVSGGIGVKGKTLYNLKTQKELMELPSSIAARKAATTLKESGIDFKQPQEDIQKQFDELLKKNNVAQEGSLGEKKEAIIDFLTGRGKELEVEDFIKQFDGTALKKIDYRLEKAVDTIGTRLRNFAKEVPEFTLNPTFTFEKESSQLVFKDRYRFAFYPSHFGLDAEQLKDGQTIRFDLESFGIKPATTKQIKLTEPFLGEPKILGRTTPTQLKSVEAAKKRVVERKAREKAEQEAQIKKAEQEQKKELAEWGLKPNQEVTVTGFQGITEKGQLIDVEKDYAGKPHFVVKVKGTAHRYIPEHILEVKHFLAKKKTFGAPSKIGFPGVIAGREMPTTMEPIGKPPISAREIITHLSKALKVTYANMATHRPRRAAGWYEIRPVGIRQINVRDLDTASHEVGHHIDHYYKIRQAGISKAGRKTWKMPEGTAKGTAAELMKLGKMLYGETKPPGGYKSEGIAEFIRGYLTGHLDIEKEAPNFYKWFTTDYLRNNPEVADGLLNARDMLTDYRLQGAEARIESQINRKEIIGGITDRAKGANLWFQTMFVDEFAPLRVAMEEVGIEREKLKPSEDPYELAVYFSQKEGARARQMVLNGTIDLWGNKTGKGLKEIMKSIADQNAVRPFTHFVVAARSLDLLKRGIKPGISKADAQHVYDLYKDNVGWKETAKEITDWNSRVLDYLVQAGALEPSVAARMRELNPIYVPFLRAFVKGEKRFGGGGAGKGLITTKRGVFSIKGSGREIIDPFESMITQTRRMISIAHKSVIARALANLEVKHRGLAGFIWKVPPPKKATTFRAEQIKKQLMEKGVEFPEAGLEEMDALLTVYGNSPIYLGKENIIAIVQNGKKTWYEVSPEMYRLLQGLDKFYLPRFLDVILGKPGRAVRLGATGINASFGLVKNPIRDSLDTIFKGTHARGPGASIVGVAKDLSRLGLAKSLGINPSKAAQEFVAMGGQISGFIGQDRKSLQHLRGEMLASSVGRYTIQTVSHPIDALRQVFGVPESGPRIQEYEKALIVGEKKYGKGSPDAKVYAFNKAQDQTINYSRHGVIGKWLNQMIPFWNANAQDISKVHRTFRTRGKEATAYAIAFLTLPALGLWWYNKDEEWYKELPAYEKANYLHIRLPGKYKLLRIPVPFLVGHIFQGFPVATIDALYRADHKKITDFFEQVLKADIYPLVEWPAIIGPVIDVLQNKDWAGRPIIPKGVEGKLPSDQYKDYTSEFCKIIGRIFKYSPAKIEHLLNSWSGGLYRRVAGTAELVAGRREKELQPADWPVIGKILVRDPYAPKDSIERFYEERERLNQMYQSDKVEAGSELDRKRKRYNYISTKYLSLYWKRLQKTKLISERKRIYGKIGELIRKAEKTE